MSSKLAPGIVSKLKKAHALSGAPGEYSHYRPDGRYVVKLDGRQRVYRFRVNSNLETLVTVFCEWKMGDQRFTKQVTVG